MKINGWFDYVVISAFAMVGATFGLIIVGIIKGFNFIGAVHDYVFKKPKQ